MLIEAHTTAGYINSNILKDILSTSKVKDILASQIYYSHY